MKINEVESLVGISKKNIRFYEEQGLLSPKRNAENGYREYTDEDADILLRIRLLRKLDVPIEEIRRMMQGIHTVGDGMRRHIITLEREQRNLQQSIELCRSLQTMEKPVSELDAREVLEKMEELEKSGTTFRDVSREDIQRRYTAAIVVTLLAVAFFLSLCWVMVWAYQVKPEDAPPVPMIGMFCTIFLFMAAGAVLALIQRIQEIRKGEIDDARNY